jgi:hypothetical protein
VEGKRCASGHLLTKKEINLISCLDDAYSTAGPATSEQGSTIPIGSALPPPPPPQEIICGLPKRAFWIIFTVVTSLCVIAIIVGGAVGGTRHQESQSSNGAVGKSTVSSSNPTAYVTVTVGPTSLSPSTTTTSSVTKTSVCVGGTGAGNYAGLCGFACSYGYCPPGPCTCTTSGTPVPTPATHGVDGVPLKGEADYDSYLGLCSYCCDHGYCPKSACTTKAA